MTVIANPKESLRACEALLGPITELLVDVEGQARDGGLSDIEAQVQSLLQATRGVLAGVRGQLAGMERR